MEAEENKSNQKPFWQSTKWWSAVFATLVPAANTAFGLGLDLTQISTIITPALVYILGQGVADFGKNAKKDS